MDSGSVWLLMGHDGALLEYTARQSQGSGPGVWRGHLYKTLGKNFVPHVRSVESVLGTLKNHNGNANENVASKYKFALHVLLCVYSNSFDLYNVAQLSNNRTGGNGVQVETEIETFTVMCSRSPQSLEFSHFTLWFGRARWRNVPNS